MELPRLIEAMSDPRSYPEAVETVEVQQTHISAVFLAGSFVYKIKKPVAPGFLDFTTLENRLHFCREEVRLNRRLAPDVYLGVVPIVPSAAGVRVEAEGDAVEWAVKMRRLPEEATLLKFVQSGAAEASMVHGVAQRIAAFHRAAETNERIASFGRFDSVAQNIRDIFKQSSSRIAETVVPAVFERVRSLMEDSLAWLRPVIDGRAVRGIPRDCHGDLHLDHIYCFPGQPPPGDLVIIDCIEFNERFRFIDPVADMAFASMDLVFQGRRDLAHAFADSYFRAAGDEEGRVLLPLYTAYRAAVRGMVDGLMLGEKEVPEAERNAAARRSQAHWLLALSELETPSRRPCLVLVAGLPGTGKSTLAWKLGERAGFEVIRSDIVRKEMAGQPPNEPTPPHLRAELYSQKSSDRTYGECLNRATQLLSAGRRVLVDANFRHERQRQTFLNAAIRCGAPAAIIVCTAHPETIRRRLRERTGDASDADWDVYRQAADDWEEAGPDVDRVLCSVSTDGATEQAIGSALDFLRRLGMME
jgi:aminoglycoside phosphotransferase family enzyme/predicted kinase